MIYKDLIEATKIPVEWYSWMHSIKNKIEDTHKLKKYDWQLNHSSNKQELKKHTIHKRIRMPQIKNIKLGIINLIF